MPRVNLAIRMEPEQYDAFKAAAGEMKMSYSKFLEHLMEVKAGEKVKSGDSDMAWVMD